MQIPCNDRGMRIDGDIPASFLEALRLGPGEPLRAGACARRTVTVLFSDLGGWTRLAAQLDAAALLALLNRYLGHVVPAIHAAGGYVDKFIGDGLMALFDGPSSDGALDAARGVLRGLAAFDRERAGELPLEATVGLHTGEVVIGGVGAAGRVDFTAIGETVNTAARVHGLCRRHGAAILVSDAAVAALRAPARYTLAVVDPAAQLKGLPAPVALHRLAP